MGKMRGQGHMDESMVVANEDGEIVERSDEPTSAVATINRNELEVQLAASHRFPRSIKKFLDDARSMAGITREVAESCIYTLPRAGKPITGPSVRLAEICANAYGNLQIGARVIDVEDREIVAQGVVWDTERNTRVVIETRRRITDKQGRRFNDDMIGVTGSAATSIALRNAVFRVVPRAYVDVVYEHARQVAVGDAKTLEHRRKAVLANLARLGIAQERVLEKVGKSSVDDIGLAELEVLIGVGTSIRDGTGRIEEHFPSHAGEQDEALEAKIRARAEEGKQ